MRIIHILGILVLLALAVPASPAHAGGIVRVCDEAHLLTALAGGGTVTFACSGTITLTAEIVIAADTTIDGSGQTVTISGNNAVRVFTVNSGVTLNLNELTVANGKAGGGGSISGGGINNYGTVNVTNSTFSNNDANCQGCSGGGIANHPSRTLVVSGSIFVGNSARQGGGIANYDGMLTISNSTLSNNEANCEDCYGGGIYNRATNGILIATNNTFSRNRAGRGGGMYNDSRSRLAVSNSTFSDNSAYQGGGGVANVGYLAKLTVSNSTFFRNYGSFGGGIYNSGLLTVSDCTLFDNNGQFGGATYNGYGGVLTVSNSSFFDNNATVSGGGINNFDGLVILKNTIVANSLGTRNCHGTITDGGGNLSYPDTTCPGINADPMFGPLQDNGGPTQTMALLLGSAAIDAGIDAICAAPPVNNLENLRLTPLSRPRVDENKVIDIRVSAAVVAAVVAVEMW